MKNILFTSGTITKFDGDLFTIELFSGRGLVYSAHIDMDAAIKLIGKHKTIKIIN